MEGVLRDARSSDREKLQANALKAQDKQNWDDAVAYWKSLIFLDPENAMAYFGLGNSLTQFGKLKVSVETEERYKQAFNNYKISVEIKPDFQEAYNNWGNVLSDLASHIGEEDLYIEAFEKFAEAVRINPDFHEAYYNWGIGVIERYYDCLCHIQKVSTQYL